MVDPQPKPDGVGKRHITNNRVECITNYFQNYFTKETIKENRLILFVPLKCEKWYYRTTNSESYGANPNEINYMREIANKIEKGYKGLIEWFKSPDLADKCTVAITPILSVGGMRFKDFGEGDSEKAIERERFMKIREKGYSPKYCEQPLLYTLAFAFKVFNKRKKEVEDNKLGIVKIW